MSVPTVDHISVNEYNRLIKNKDLEIEIATLLLIIERKISRKGGCKSKNT